MVEQPMAELGPEIFFATVVELGAKIAAKEVSAEELVRAFANRLEQLGPRYNALALPLKVPRAKCPSVVARSVRFHFKRTAPGRICMPVSVRRANSESRSIAVDFMRP